MKSDGAWIWRWPSIDIQMGVTKEVGEILSNHRQMFEATERGGQLFVSTDRPDGLWLAEASLPHIDDQAGYSWLALDAKRCREEIIDANNRGLRLVGYWHTHPEEFPQLSSQDRKSLKKFSKDNSDILPNPLAVIVGRSLEKEGIRAWSYRSNEAYIATLILNE